MNEIKRSILLTGLKLFDLGLLMISYVLATILVVHAHQGSSLTEFLSMRVKLGNLVSFSIVMFIWHLIFLVFGMCGS